MTKIVTTFIIGLIALITVSLINNKIGHILREKVELKTSKKVENLITISFIIFVLFAIMVLIFYKKN